MATGTQLERIAGLSDRVTPLRGKQRGMRIEADDWNSLVDAFLGILEVERVQEGGGESILDQRFAGRNHAHLGEVDADWLDTDLQTRLSGGVGSISTRAGLADLQKRIDAVAAEVARLTALTEGQQKLLDRSTVDNLTRERKLNTFDERFATVEGLRAPLTALQRQADTLGQNVDKVLELRKTLEDPAGNPIDVGKLSVQIKELGNLRALLTGVDGSLLRARDLEIKIQQLEDAVGLGAGHGLDERLNTITAASEERLAARTDERIASETVELKAEQDASLAAVQNQLAKQFADQSAALAASTTQQVAAAETRLAGSQKTALDAAAADIRASVVAGATQAVDNRIATLASNMDVKLAAAQQDIQRAVQDAVTQNSTVLINSRTTEISSALSKQAAAIETRVAALEQSVPQLVTNQMASARDALTRQMTDQVAQQVLTARQDIQAAMLGQVTAAVQSSVGNLDARITASVQSSLSGLDQMVTAAVSKATAGLPTLIADQVKTQMATAIQQPLATLKNDLTTQMQAALNQVTVDQAALRSAAINETANLLRRELQTSLDTRIGTMPIDMAKAVDSLRSQVLEIQKIIDGLRQDNATFRSDIAEIRKKLGMDDTLRPRPIG
jgi:hypothetical protein